MGARIIEIHHLYTLLANEILPNLLRQLADQVDRGGKVIGKWVNEIVPLASQLGFVTGSSQMFTSGVT